MDIIDRAIEKKMHITKKKSLQQQTWEQFENESIEKKIFIFGMGACANFFWRRYRGSKTVEGAIDNSAAKQGFCVGDFIDESFGENDSALLISDISILNQYDPYEIVVLVASTKNYEDIILQLADIGIYQTYALLIMEANERIKLGKQGIEADEYIKNYVEESCKVMINNKKIVFWAFNQYADHGKYITEALLSMRDDLDIVWLVNDLRYTVPKGVRLVFVGNKKKYIYEMETAHIWIFNAPVPDFIRKREDQIYIQTKHWASITLKRFYLDSKTITDIPEDVEYWKRDSRKIDYIFTGSDFDTESSRRGFNFHKEIIQIGSPRSDAMFKRNEKRIKVYANYKMNLNNHMMLYAPTYRYQKNIVNHYAEIRDIDLTYEAVKKALEKRFGGEWYIVLRLHPGHEDEVKKLDLPDFVIDASGYGDGEELAAACDIMISDYSSIMFEPAFVKKPVFLFATDKKSYIDKEYDMLIDYDTLPFAISESNEELVNKIESFNWKEYEKNVDAFMNKYNIHEDGYASQRAAEFIVGII